MRLMSILLIALSLIVPRGALAANELQEAPMQVVPVVLEDPACGTHCPRWIAAQGRITDQTPALFREVLRKTKGESLPILIDSGGGRVAAALEIGRLLRQAKAHVVVSATRFADCAPGSKDCRPKQGVWSGRPFSFAARCSSACPYLIAGATRRSIPPFADIGVHRMAQVDQSGHEVPVVNPLSKSSMQTEFKLYGQVRDYLHELGLPDPLVALSYTADHNHIRILTPEELKTTELATDETPAEKLFNLPRLGFDEYSIVGTPAAMLVPPLVENRNGGKLVERPAAAVLQIGLGGTTQQPQMLMLVFTRSDVSDAIIWHAQLYRSGANVPLTSSRLSVETPTNIIIPSTVMQTSWDPAKSNGGAIDRATFCRFRNESSALFLLDTPRPGLLPLTFRGGRWILPWIDIRLFRICDNNT